MRWPRLRAPHLGLRGKLAAAALVLAALPWVGWLYVQELERFLMEAQSQALMGTARAIATALHDRPWLVGARTGIDPQRQAEEELRQLAAERSATEAARDAAQQGGSPEPPPAPPKPAPKGGSGDGATLDSLGGKPAAPATPAAENAAAEAAANAAPEGSPIPPESERDVRGILRGIERSTSRLWVVNREYRVLASAGSLRRAGGEEPESDWLESAAHFIFSGLIEGPSEDFDEASPQEALANNQEVASAFQGAPRSAARRSKDGKAVIMSAAYPIWSDNEVVGAVIAEETTNSILSVRSRALERLMLTTFAAFLLAAILLATLAGSISGRIRRLRDETERAIDAQGRIAGDISISADVDEIGDLSRSFSGLLARLAEHHTYLENMASRLSHELRTPVAVVRSSLENLKLGASPEEARVYLDRAEEGLARLATILTRMSEAARLEQGLATTERQPFEVAEVLRGCIEGYRLAFAGRTFELELPEGPVTVEGSPDLLAQLLDKLVDNANDFAAPGTPIRIRLERTEDEALLSVVNLGASLPEGMRDRLFASMVSIRSGSTARGPHLGLGLHIARLITQFHSGTIRAENLAEGGVRIVVRLPLVPAPAAAPA